MRKSSTSMRQLWWVAPCVALLLLTPAAALVEESINLVLGGKYGYSKIYDITNKIVPGMTIWGNANGMPEEKLRFINEINGELVYKLSTHLGTHSDASGHVYQDMLDKGFDANSLNLETLNGLALLMDAPRNKNLTVLALDARSNISLEAEVLKFMNIPRGVKRVLFRTENTYRGLLNQKAFAMDYVGLQTDGAEWLVANTDIKLIGMDYLSVALELDGPQVHRILLAKGDIIPVEGLLLVDLNPGFYMIHCSPLRIPGADGSPTRCILTQ